jgi:peptide/nickel transport system substrate-binding protein
MKATASLSLALTALALGVLSAATAALAAPPKDTIVIAHGVDAATLDPAQLGARDETNIADHIWVTLYDKDENGTLEPYLADSYKTSDDGKSYDFHLRPGAVCEDGQPMDAEAVAYSFNRAADPKNKFVGDTPSFIFTSIGFDKAVALDKQDVRIVTTKYNPIAVQLMTNVFLHCKLSYEKMTLEQAARHPVGSGPYRLTEWVQDDHITLEKVKGFKLRDVKPEKVIWRVIPEALTRAAELMAGNIDIITNVLPDQIATIDASGTAKVQPVAGTRRIYVGFNLNAKFADTPGGKAIQKPEVRRALQYAIDVPTLCDTLLKTKCTRATGPVNPPNDDKALQPYPYDPDQAEKLLDAAGYPRGKDGIRFSLTLQSPNGRYLADGDISQAIAQFLTDIGVDTKVQFLDWTSVYIPLIRAHNAGPLFLLSSGGRTYSAISDLSDFATPDAGTNYTGWQDPEFFSKWHDILSTKDPAEQTRAVDQMLQIFYDRGPWLLLYFQPDFYGVGNRIDWTARRDERVLINDATVR